VDKVFIMQFDMAVHIRQGLTALRRDLEEALAYVDTPTREQLKNQLGGGTLLFDAVVTASKDFMKRQTGRKALILLTDGVDTGSDSPITEAIEAAQRTDTLIYSILFADAGAYGGFGADGRKGLQRMSRETGGGFFEVSKKQSIEQIFEIIQDELRSQYNIGYVSDLPVSVSEWRKIQLVTKQKGLVIQARDRYWAQR
jgi:VWFA-related protein